MGLTTWVWVGANDYTPMQIADLLAEHRREMGMEDEAISSVTGGEKGMRLDCV